LRSKTKCNEKGIAAKEIIETMLNFFRRKKTSPQPAEIASEAADHLNALLSRQAPLPLPEGNKPEHQWGHDFSKIRIFDDAHRAGMTRGLKAKSFFATRD